MTLPPFEATILAEIDARRADIVALLSELVRIPSVSYEVSGDERDCQAYVEKTLKEMGLEVDVFRPDELPGIQEHPAWSHGHDYTNRPNVVGTRRGAGHGRSLLLLAHVDVFPEGPHDLWRHGPFNPTLEGNVLVGRGSNDDKGGLAAQIMALSCIESAGFRVQGDVGIASVVDEESGGANGTLAALHRPHHADAAVYCDGISLDVHTSSLGGINARIVVQMDLQQIGRTISATTPVALAVYEALAIWAGTRTELFERDPLYNRSLWSPNAVRISRIEVGSDDASNPGAIAIDIGMYVLPGEKPTDVFDELVGRLEEALTPFGQSLERPPSVKLRGKMMPPSVISAEDHFVGLVAEAYSDATGMPPRYSGGATSDLFQFLLHSPVHAPAIAIGPGQWGVAGSAHEPNEAVQIDNHLIPFVKLLALVISRWCGIESRE